MSDRRSFIMNRMVGKTITSVIQNFLLNREAAQRNSLDPPDRNLNAECGYPDNPTIDDYFQWYSREGLATRVVDLWPDECWAVNPELYEVEDRKETPFEKAWKALEDEPELNPWHYFHRIDKLSGIGRYGVLLLGFDDELDLSKPVAGLNDEGKPAPGRPPKGIKLAYIRCFTEQHCKVKEIVSNGKSLRIGKPRLYSIMIQEVTNTEIPDEDVAGFTESEKKDTVELVVHWTRVIHVAERNGESETYGTPRLENVLNRCFDVRKILGGSAEMFWKGGFPGYSVESLPDQIESEPLDKESISEEFQLFMNGLQRYLAVEGVTIKSLSPQVADPREHIFQQLLMIACALKCPLQILIGDDSGKLTSEEIQKRWNSRIARRQKDTITPMLIRPFVQRLMDVGALPKVSSYHVAWRDLNSVKETDRADIAVKTSQAILQYVTSGAEKVFPLGYFITHVLGWSDDIAKAIEKEVKKPDYAPLTKDLWKQKLLPGSGTTQTANKTGIQGNGIKQTARNTT